MTDPNKEAALIQVLVERLETQRLPRALELKARVDGGAVLDDIDIAFLEQVFHDSAQIKPFLDKHPEWQDLAGQVMHLYHDITAKALENQQASR
jgi:hypothetical protein